MEKLGVIGGMGAEATSYYYDQVVRHTAAAYDQEHIDMVVLSKSTMPDRTLAIITGDHDELLATMKECAQALEALVDAMWAMRKDEQTHAPLQHFQEETVEEETFADIEVIYTREPS